MVSGEISCHDTHCGVLKPKCPIYSSQAIRQFAHSRCQSYLMPRSLRGRSRISLQASFCRRMYALRGRHLLYMGVVGRGRGGDGVPHFFGLKFVQKLVHCCNWLLTETQCKIISVQHVCRPKSFKKSLSKSCFRRPSLFRTTPLML